MRSGSETRIALSGVAPIPWLLDGVEALEQATPLPGTAYKLELARALVERALDAVASANSRRPG
jgi:xanthine dehydrogenase YagS FAD-binding subunit